MRRLSPAQLVAVGALGAGAGVVLALLIWTITGVLT